MSRSTETASVESIAPRLSVDGPNTTVGMPRVHAAPAQRPRWGERRDARARLTGCVDEPRDEPTRRVSCGREHDGSHGDLDPIVRYRPGDVTAQLVNVVADEETAVQHKLATLRHGVRRDGTTDEAIRDEPRPPSLIVAEE